MEELVRRAPSIVRMIHESLRNRRVYDNLIGKSGQRIVSCVDSLMIFGGVERCHGSRCFACVHDDGVDETGHGAYDQ